MSQMSQTVQASQEATRQKIDTLLQPDKKGNVNYESLMNEILNDLGGDVGERIEEFLDPREKPETPSIPGYSPSAGGTESNEMMEAFQQKGQELMRGLTSALSRNLAAMNTTQAVNQEKNQTSGSGPNFVGGLGDVFDAMESMNQWLISGLQQIQQNQQLNSAGDQAQANASAEQNKEYEDSLSTTETILRVILDVVTMGLAELSPNYSSTLQSMASSNDLQDVIKGITIAVSAISIIASLATGNVAMALVAALLLAGAITGETNKLIGDLASALGGGDGTKIGAEIALAVAVAAISVASGGSGALATLGNLVSGLSQGLMSTNFTSDVAEEANMNSSQSTGFEIGMTAALLVLGAAGSIAGGSSSESSNLLSKLVANPEQLQQIAQTVNQVAQAYGAVANVAGGSVDISQGVTQKVEALLEAVFSLGDSISNIINSDTERNSNQQKSMMEEYQTISQGWANFALPAEATLGA